MNQETQELISRMLLDESRGARLSGAIRLMRHKEPEVQRAYVKALSDPFDKVIMLACKQIGWRGEGSAIEPLRALLHHDVWMVRFAACHALLSLQAVDSVLIQSLEELSLAPEAREFDQDIEEIRESEQEEFRVRPRDVFGTVGFLLSQARSM